MKKLAALIILIITLLQCTNNTPLPNGYELLDRENKIGLVPPVTIYPTRMGSYWRTVPAGSRGSLLFGTGKDSKSFIILQDRNLAKIETDATVVSAKFSIYSSSHVGETSPFAFTVHRIEREWDESTVVWNDVKDVYNTEALESWEFTPGDTAWYSFEFTNINFITEWIQNVHQSTPTIRGIVLEFDQAPGGTIFVSSESSSHPPYVEVVSQNTAGELDTTVAYVTEDASLLQNTNGTDEFEFQENPEVLKVGNATGCRGLMQFDLSDIPKEATIHQALLTFQLEPDDIYEPGDAGEISFTVALAALDSTGEWENAETILLDSRYSSALDVASSANQTFAFDSPSAIQQVSRIVQAWVSERLVNKGILLYPYYQASDYNEMAFKSGISNTEFLPSLKITYSLPAAHRFAQ